MDTILEVQGIHKTFVRKRVFGKAITVQAVQDVSFELGRGEVLVIAGESGSGKSTIAKIILGAIPADSGSIKYDGVVVDGKKSWNMIRKGCQMIHQDPYDSINPRMRIHDIISEALSIHHVGDATSRREMVRQALADTKLDPDQIQDKYPHMLSGGQRQRVVLARALVVKPKVIIADEPVSMLDVSIRAEMLSLMQELQQKRDISFLYITHDLATARHFGRRMLVLYKGAVVESGDMDTLLDSPSHPYTKALLDAISEPDPQNRLRYRPVSDWGT